MRLSVELNNRLRLLCRPLSAGLTEISGGTAKSDRKKLNSINHNSLCEFMIIFEQKCRAGLRVWAYTILCFRVSPAEIW